jgi:UDPglucose 6-dehydrogenase
MEIIMMNKVAIVGNGFVGTAVQAAFPFVDLTIVDPAKYNNDITILKDRNDIEFVFVCVPTPMNDDGSIDSSIVEETVTYLLENTKSIIIIKSTITPDVIGKFDDERVVYNPEFLTEKNATRDFIDASFHVLGGEIYATEKVKLLYVMDSICDLEAAYIEVTKEEASFIKYGINCYLASKVMWFNQFANLIESTGGHYGTIMRTMQLDKRIGKSHMEVPGPDGRVGFGGKCFIKDTLAFARFAQKQNEDFTILEEVIRSNNTIRGEYEELLDSEIGQNIDFTREV